MGDWADVIEDADGQRFILNVGTLAAFADYRLATGTLVISHVEAHPELRGSGAAAHLMEEITRIATERGLKIRPLCSYADAWMRRNKRDDLRG
jgi:uncharacterized protein